MVEGDEVERPLVAVYSKKKRGYEPLLDLSNEDYEELLRFFNYLHVKTYINEQLPLIRKHRKTLCGIKVTKLTFDNYDYVLECKEKVLGVLARIEVEKLKAKKKRLIKELRKDEGYVYMLRKIVREGGYYPNSWNDAIISRIIRSSYEKFYTKFKVLFPEKKGTINFSERGGRVHDWDYFDDKELKKMERLVLGDVK